MPLPDPDEVAVVIDGQRFRYWSEVEVTLSLDSMSTVELMAPWDSHRHDLREVFRPFTFKPIQVLLGGKPLFTGTLVGSEPESDVNSSTVKLSGYSLPGVLGDCYMPAAKVPFEFNKQTFDQILSAITAPFGLEVDIQANTGAAFEKAAIEVDKRPLEFLIELAKQRVLLLSSTPEGALLCWRAISTGNPVARLQNRPAGTVKASFSSQDYFSEVTGFVPNRRKKQGSRYTAKNPWLIKVLRPMTFRLDDTEAGDAPGAVTGKLSRVFANMAAFSVENLPTWRDPQGDLWAPNTTVELESPDVMIYKPYEFLIRNVSLKATADEQTASLNVVMPGAFSGEMPETLPWQEGPPGTGADPNVEDEVLGEL